MSGLMRDAALCSQLLELLTTHPLLQPWWENYRNRQRKAQWSVEQCHRTRRYELHVTPSPPSAAQRQASNEAAAEEKQSDSRSGDGEKLVAETLLGILVAVAKGYLKKHFRVHLRRDRTKMPPPTMPVHQSRPGARHYFLALDRQHWDQWAQQTFQQPPQNPDPQQWAHDRERMSASKKTRAKGELDSALSK